MAIQHYAPLDMNGCEFRSSQAEQLAADPSGAGLWPGRQWFNTTDGVNRIYDGTNIIDLVTAPAVQLDGGDFEGPHDASGGAFPTPAADVLSGDFWRVSVGGTLPNGDVVEPGDIIIALADNPDPAVNAEWMTLQGNLNLNTSTLVNCEQQTVNLVADTALAVTSANLARVTSWKFLDASGNEIKLCVERTANNQITLTSCVDLTGVVVEMNGCG